MKAYLASSRRRRQARAALLCGALLSLLSTLPAAALEVAGARVEEHYRSAGGQELVLNGAGIRTKFFVKVYVGALYLPRKTREAAEALEMNGAKRVEMHILYGEIEARKLRDGWSEGFEANQDEATLARLAERIEKFNAMFPDVRKGDTIAIDLAGGATRVSVNGQPAGTVEGADFANALLAIWLGEHPADRGLKRGMLGH